MSQVVCTYMLCSCVARYDPWDLASDIMRPGSIKKFISCFYRSLYKDRTTSYLVSSFVEGACFSWS
jgi:hypothetical protein